VTFKTTVSGQASFHEILFSKKGEKGGFFFFLFFFSTSSSHLSSKEGEKERGCDRWEKWGGIVVGSIRKRKRRRRKKKKKNGRKL
jgi:hypothetical protein